RSRQIPGRRVWWVLPHPRRVNEDEGGILGRVVRIEVRGSVEKADEGAALTFGGTAGPAVIALGAKRGVDKCGFVAQLLLAATEDVLADVEVVGANLQDQVTRVRIVGVCPSCSQGIG